MINKVIHYCWFGNGQKSKFVEKCIDSWKKKLPDYEIIEWNESNFDINISDFTKKAYENKKWAFVADYARMYALYNYGGIYLDTDVEMVREFTDTMLKQKNFLCFEDSNHVSTACIGSEKGSSFIKECLNYYDSIKYTNDDKLDTTPNSEIIYSYLLKDSVPNYSGQLINNVMIYSSDYFSPKSYYTKKINMTKNTICIHHFDGTWKKKSDRFKDKIKVMARCILGEKLYLKLKNSRKSRKI